MRKEMYVALKEALELWAGRASGIQNIDRECPLCEACRSYNDENVVVHKGFGEGCDDCPINEFVSEGCSSGVPYSFPYTVKRSIKMVKILVSLLPEKMAVFSKNTTFLKGYEAGLKAGREALISDITKFWEGVKSEQA